MKSKIVKFLNVMYFYICINVMLMPNVSAYIDPSVMTYAIQAIAGIAIAIGAVVGMYFRKAKKKISSKLNIDENKNKEVESDEIIVDSSKNK